MSGTPNERVLALAGLLQATLLVRQVARQGNVDAESFRASLESILQTDAATTEDVYGGLAGIRMGLEALTTLFSSATKERDLEVIRYGLAVIHLERKLRKNPAMLKTLEAGIARVKAQTAHFDVNHENVVANVADVYAQTISKLTPRIVVSGEHGYLTAPQNADKVRALLLAAMRSAVLWHQKGGNRLQLILGRSKLMRTAQALLAEA